MSQKAWKIHANCLYICLTKVILLPSKNKRLFSLVADSPQTIGFSGTINAKLATAKKKPEFTLNF
jgi:hypothetical protein